MITPCFSSPGVLQVFINQPFAKQMVNIQLLFFSEVKEEKVVEFVRSSLLI